MAHGEDRLGGVGARDWRLSFRICLLSNATAVNSFFALNATAVNSFFALNATAVPVLLLVFRTDNNQFQVCFIVVCKNAPDAARWALPILHWHTNASVALFLKSVPSCETNTSEN